MEHINLKNNLSLTRPDGLININVVKGADGYYLANQYIPSSYIINGIFDIDNVPDKVLPDPTLPNIIPVKTYIMTNELELEIITEENIELPFDYQKIFGIAGYRITYKEYESEEEKLFSIDKKITIPIDFSNIEYLYIYPSYEKKDLSFADIFMVIESAEIF